MLTEIGGGLSALRSRGSAYTREMRSSMYTTSWPSRFSALYLGLLSSACSDARPSGAAPDGSGPPPTADARPSGAGRDAAARDASGRDASSQITAAMVDAAPAGAPVDAPRDVSGGTTLALPAPLTPSVEVFASCKGEADMALCGPSETPEIPGLAVCLAQGCQVLSCQDAFECEPVAPYFPWPRPGLHELERGTGDEPIVEDRVTALRWQGCLAGLHGQHCDQGDTRVFDTASAANSYCDALTWGGADDWVLPDLYALVSLLNLGMPRSVIGEDEKGVPIAGDDVTPGEALSRTAFPRLENKLLLTGSGGLQTPIYASADRGVVDRSAFGEGLTALCMRRPQGTIATPGERGLRVKGLRGEVMDFDLLTRTLWGPDATMELSLIDAILFCDELEWGGYDDWRLPDVKELFGVFDFSSSRFSPARDRLRSWSGRAVDNFSGSSSWYSETTPYPTRCVRYPD